MDRMFRVLAFWTGIFAVLFFAGNMAEMAFLFFAQTAALLALSYLKLSERVYIYIFGAYCTIFFVGFTFYTHFLLVPSFGH
ncbi:DUF2626 domain-containing protein [Alkalihalobacillus trypoxylicola]|uniref:DUF2626 domain-containing protein n=1 Tax=Alkalihalobacillus trypoxylicola TaxID=519424 RepID=A0A161PDM9_9BACI|nr:DUF2626 domain-containing protein [Alkalihalobacillus trypoxylicola]KYG30982.1 hypothetical protein AZF04_18470 [Alkalihalobacillus trypoxylicola]GAF63778.1 hypothetical protein BTS2_0670 [Bacillus sp. TS-2]